MISLDVTGLVGIVQSLTRGKRVRAAAQRGLESAADELVEEIRAAAPEHDGTLRESVQHQLDEEPLSIVITAGGEATTKTSAAGRPYDYAMATEFGTQREPAKPFFHSTLRAKEKEAVDRHVGGAVADEMGD